MNRSRLGWSIIHITNTWFEPHFGSVTGILAWQPDQGRLVRRGFISNGDHYTVIYNQFSDEQWSGTVGGIVNGERPGDSPAAIAWTENQFSYKDNVFTIKATRAEVDSDR